MKKFIVFSVVLALLVPSLALAAAEFTLGGFIKLDAFWDSTQEGKNMNTPIQPFNVGYFQHNRMKFTAQGSRFNFTIKGPDLFGAKTSGFMEVDFDAAETGTMGGGSAAGATGVGNTASQSYTPRLRHAMFRLNWPETELLFGQYWSMFCEWYPELVEDGPFQGTGAPTARIPQIRLTQKFLGWGTAALLIGEANNTLGGQVYSTVDNSGESAAVPQVQGKLQYQQDIYGKAAYYGTPTPFTAKLTAGWQRTTTNSQASTLSGFTFGKSTWSTAFPIWVKHQTLDPWLAMATVFAPVIPTHSANLAGTASLLAQWWIGQGVEVFGFSGGGNYYRFNNNKFGVKSYDAELQTRFGGEVQGQYYFTNQWFLTAAYGMSKNIGVSPADTSFYAATPGGTTTNPVGYIYAFTSAPPKLWQQAEVALWYRPIQAIKFGLEYAYGYTSWFQSTTAAATGSTFSTAYTATPVNTGHVGNAHRVEFVGFFYF